MTIRVLSPKSSPRGLLAIAVLAGGLAMVRPCLAAEPAVVMDGALVGAGQMTLYTLDRDAVGAGKSACNDGCAINWPPLLANADAKAGGDWGVIQREDGRMQWTYKGSPLYYWSKDQKPGDRGGDGLNSVWHAAKP